MEYVCVPDGVAVVLCHGSRSKGYLFMLAWASLHWGGGAGGGGGGGVRGGEEGGEAIIAEMKQGDSHYTCSKIDFSHLACPREP